MENASFDAYSPREIAGRVEAVGAAKATMPFLSLVMLGVLAGAFRSEERRVGKECH